MWKKCPGIHFQCLCVCVSVWVLRSRLRMWLQSLPLCGALIKCGCGVTPCLRWPGCGATASSPSCWQCLSHWLQGSCSLYSAVSTFGRMFFTLLPTKKNCQTISSEGFSFCSSDSKSRLVHFSVSFQVDHALCSASSHQHALDQDRVEQHTEHSHQPLLQQYWTVLQPNYHPFGKTWRQIEKPNEWKYLDNTKRGDMWWHIAYWFFLVNYVSAKKFHWSLC